ncbi:aminotransferase class III-fold pyridoxal phosphate-dependent enzyme [Streptomyces sp. NPDC012616]|uniref:aspartate aminotransferase family protein n=1 Tax=Streptomyces sp. NPDC012616 TaxID=3364840 RepID=UPI0036E9AB06
MSNTAYMVNGFDVSTVDALDPHLQEIVKRRSRLLGPAYKLFYANPVQFVRSEGVHLYDAQGNAYLDVYNNVPSVGHAHPHVTAAITRQAQTLNTHTRYAAEPILDYAERLLATHTEGLGNVMFTCTGSEAVDLALRITRFQTGGTGIVVTSNAYHGLTSAVAEISPTMGPSVPLGPYVRTVPPPDPYRTDGRDVGAAFAEGVAAAIADLERHGIRFAGFIADTLFSTDGILPDPAGFLKPVVDIVHRAGGLYIADEVQPGFARTGDAMWGYQRHGILPDLVVMGKPMGNGMPIAGVVARPEILADFGTKIRYFNTFGGNSVSIAAAAAVLDVIEDEKLLDNSRTVGQYLREGVGDLAKDHPRMGAVRGAGLYVAADFIHPDTGAPDGDLALAVVNGLRERRVLISATGAQGSILKIRPPLPFTRAHVDTFIEALSDVLATVEIA